MAAMPTSAPALRRTAVVAVAVALTGCTSGSSHHASSPSPSPVVSPPVSSSPGAPPVIDPGNEAVDDITGTGTITLSDGSPPVRVATTADSPGQLSVDASGHVRVEVSMGAKDGS